MISGVLVVIGAVLIGFIGDGGQISALWQPFEFLIICGGGFGSFLIANPKDVVIASFHGLKRVYFGPKYKKAEYVELLIMLYTLLKYLKIKGTLALEKHIENPLQSPLFEKFPLFKKDNVSVVFFCDYMRLLTIGTDNPNEIEALMEVDIDSILNTRTKGGSALKNLADSLPALGIVAAVLGVIHTMSSISEPPEILGHMIGSALVGTFTGILLSYGFIGPMGDSIVNIAKRDISYFSCMKVAIVSYLQGNDATIAVEFARKCVDERHRPSFEELEQEIAKVPNISSL